MKVVLQRAKINDIKALVALELASFATDRLAKRHFTHLIHSPSAAILTAKKGERLLGAGILLFRKNSKKARLYSLAVDRLDQRQGIAKQLCQALENTARRRGCMEIHLEVRKDNRAAIQFYKRVNYHIIGVYKAYYADGKEALRMQKQLNAASTIREIETS